jgi:hypothetical protein
MDKEEQKSLYNELKRTFNTKIDVKTGKFYKVSSGLSCLVKDIITPMLELG